MKLVTFRTDAHDRAGVLADDSVIDLAHAFAWYEHTEGRRCDAAHVAERYGKGVLGFIEHANLARPAAEMILRAVADRALPAVFDGRVLRHAPADVSLRAPLPRPPSMRDGYAFRQHVETARRNRGLEMIPEFDKFPVFYFTNHQAVVGPGDVHVRERHLEGLDYELEAAIVVGKEASDLQAGEADRVIFGMTIMNDWSARGLQMEEMKLSLGPAKGKDFATSLGPWLVTIDELLPRATETERGLVFDLPMRASVNGELLSRGNVKDMSFTFAQILERASYGVRLMPGDVIGSGTCGTGCLLELNGSAAASATRPERARNAKGDRWLKPNDLVVLEIEGLGKLQNRVVLDT
jgi:fumarylacetoacetate (FAA) hydrolase